MAARPGFNARPPPGPSEDHFVRINLANEERKLWLVKLPDQVADAWEAAAPGATLGVMKRHAPDAADGPGSGGGGGGGKRARTMPKMTVDIRACQSAAEVASEEVPTDFVLRHLGRPPSMRAFSVSQTIGEVKIDGTFRESFSLEPATSDQAAYRNFCRKRLINNAVKKDSEKVQKYDQTRDKLQAKSELFTPRSVQAAEETGGAGGGGRRAGERRVKTQHDELRNYIFEAYEKQTKYTIKELNAELGRAKGCGEQEQGHLKALLRDLCDKEQDGNKWYYRLKSKFFSSSTAEEK